MPCCDRSFPELVVSVVPLVEVIFIFFGLLLSEAFIKDQNNDENDKILKFLIFSKIADIKLNIILLLLFTLGINVIFTLMVPWRGASLIALDIRLRIT